MLLSLLRLCDNTKKKTKEKGKTKNVLCRSHNKPLLSTDNIILSNLYLVKNLVLPIIKEFKDKKLKRITKEAKQKFMKTSTDLKTIG